MLLTVLATCLMLLLTGCMDIFGGGGGNNQATATPPPTPAPPKNVAPCSLVSAQEMGDLLGAEVQTQEQKEKKSCIYTPTASGVQQGGVNTSLITINVETDQAELKFLALASNQAGDGDFKQVEGGDGQTIHSEKLKSLISLKNGVMVTVITISPLKSNSENLETSKKVIQKATSKL